MLLILMLLDFIICRYAGAGDRPDPTNGSAVPKVQPPHGGNERFADSADRLPDPIHASAH